MPCPLQCARRLCLLRFRSCYSLALSYLFFLPYASTDFSEDLKLLLSIISTIQLHLQRCLDLPVPEADIENHFDFSAGAAYGCLGLGKNPDKLFLSSIFFFTFSFSSCSFLITKCSKFHLLQFYNSVDDKLHSCTYFLGNYGKFNKTLLFSPLLVSYVSLTSFCDY